MSWRAWVAGGTGLVGRSLLALLEEAPDVDGVVSLVRRAAPGSGKVTPLEVDWEELTRAGALPDGQAEPPRAALCTLGTTRAKAGSDEAFRRVDLDYVLAFARAARAAGAERLLVVTAIGADPGSRFLYYRTKGEAEEGLRALGFASTYVLRPSMLDGEREETRPAERLGALAMRLVGPLLGAKRRPIRGEAVARALLACAREGAPGFHVLESDQIAERAARAGEGGG